MHSDQIEKQLKMLGNRLATIVPESLQLVNKTKVIEQIEDIIADLKKIEREL